MRHHGLLLHRRVAVGQLLRPHRLAGTSHLRATAAALPPLPPTPAPAPAPLPTLPRLGTRPLPHPPFVPSPQVLDTLHFVYETLDSADNRIMNVLVMVGMVLAFKAAFFFFLWRTVELSDSPKETRSSAIVPLVSLRVEDGSAEIGPGTSSLERNAVELPASVPGLREAHDIPRAAALEWVEGLVNADDGPDV